MSNKSKATHQGTCQICGATQKLPNGRLALHGYTTRWGFFSGVCTGSRHLPFEQSKDLIEGAIKQAEDKKEETLKFQAKLNEKPTEAKAWVSEYVPGSRNFPGYHAFYETEIFAVEHENEGRKWLTYSFITKDLKKEESIDNYDYSVKTLLDFCHNLNKTHAKRQDRTIGELDNYIAWQHKRIKDWKPGKLTAVKNDAESNKVSVYGLPSGYAFTGTITAKPDENTAVIRIKYKHHPMAVSGSFRFVKAIFNGERWNYSGAVAATK